MGRGPRYLHVSGLGRFHSSIHQTLSARHGVEEELSGSQTGIEAISHKALGSRQLVRHYN